MIQYGGTIATRSILIRGARQLLTVRGARAPRRGAALNELGIISDGALLVRDGILQEVGPTRRLENLAEARQAVEVNAAGRVVLPGFVDSHTHLPFPLPGMPVDDVESAARVVRANSGRRSGRSRRGSPTTTWMPGTAASRRPGRRRPPPTS